MNHLQKNSDNFNFGQESVQKCKKIYSIILNAGPYLENSSYTLLEIRNGFLEFVIFSLRYIRKHQTIIFTYGIF